MEQVWTAFTNEKDYDRALERTIAIFNAEKGSPEFIELKLLLTLVMEYEVVHYPIPMRNCINAR